MQNDIAVQETTPEFDISDFMTDPKLEEEGVWFPFGKGREVKIARSNNPAAESMIRSKFKVNRAVLEQEDDLAAKLNIDLTIEVYAHTVIKGLRVNGNEVEYTAAQGIKMMTDSRDFRDKVFTYAKQAEAYRTKAEENAVKS